MCLAFGVSVVLRRAGHESPFRLVAPAAVVGLTAELLLRGQVPAALRALNVESHAPWLRLGLLAAVAVVLRIWSPEAAQCRRTRIPTDRLVP